MRKLLPVLLLSLLSLSFLLIYQFAPFSKSPGDNGPALSKQDRIDLAIEQEANLTRQPSTGLVPRERLVEAVRLRDRIMERSQARMGASVPGILWTERGPNNVGGRTRVLLFDANDAANDYKKVWAGSVAGGLWFTNDITVTSPVWNKVNDLMENLAISAIAQNPLNPQEMYVGTGEGWFNSDAIKGLGIWKSVNGGASWNRLPSTSTFAFVNDLMIDKQGFLYASVRQQTTADATGILKSTNGGSTWTQVLGSPVFGSSARGADLEVGPTGDLFASLGTTGSSGGIYMSNITTNGTNTGNAGTWANITPNAAGTIVTPTNLWQRIEVAVAPSDANVLYALFQGAGSTNCTSIQQYNKSTNSWTVRTVPTIIDQGSNSNFTRGQCWYDLIAAVDPQNANSLYIGGIDALRSDDAGATWTQMTTWSLFAATGFTAAQGVHADHHAIVYAPNSSSRAVWGTDGGVHYTTSANSALPVKPIFFNKNTGYNVTQYYGVAIHPTLPNYFLAGAQDNGSQKFTAAGVNTTTNASGGDGAFAHIDQDDGNIQITSFVYNQYYVSTNGGTSFVSRNFNNNGGFINPTDYDNGNNILYGGNSAGTFFRWADPAVATSTGATVSCAAFGTASVTHVSVSPTVAHRVFFGLSNGSIVMVDNANTGTSVTGVVIKTGTGSVSSIAIDRNNADHLLVTYSNYGVVSVFETTNATAAAPAWTPVEGNLPDMPIRWVLFDPRDGDWALVATELGVWSTNDLDGAATAWEPTNGGLANVRVDMLQFRPSDNTIAAATHGRGLYTTVVPPLPQGPTPFIDFAVTATAATEATAATSTCRRFRDYVVNVTLAAAPLGDAILTYSVEPGGSAANGVDYDLTAGSDITAPALTQTFSSGSTSSKNITIRIYDDAEVEGTESFVIKFTVSGSTNAEARNATHTVTITDNDVAPTATTVVATAAGSSRTEYLAANSDLYYYSAEGHLIARLRNLTTQNHGCTDVRIDRAGTGALPMWNAAPSTYLTEKTVHVVPAANAAGAKYEITLYYTEAEKTGWERITGNSWNNIMLVKTPGTVAAINAANTAGVQVVTPTRSTEGSRYTLKYTFESGFSGFAAGIPGTANTAPVVFPNPFSNELRIRFATAIQGNASVSLYDTKGSLLFRGQYPGSATTLLAVDISRLNLVSRAVYFVDIVADGKRHRVKVQKL